MHRCNLKILAKNRFEKSAIFVKSQQHLANVAKSAKSAKFQKFQLDNLVDFENCCKTRVYLQRSAPIQPKTSEILPKICNYPTGPAPRVHAVRERGRAGVVLEDLRVGVALRLDVVRVGLGTDAIPRAPG